MSEIRLNTQQDEWLQAGLMLYAVDDTGQQLHPLRNQQPRPTL